MNTIAKRVALLVVMSSMMSVHADETISLSSAQILAIKVPVEDGQVVSNPPEYDLGEVPMDQSRSLVAQVCNQFLKSTVEVSLSIEGVDKNAFSLSDAGPFALAPNACKDVMITATALASWKDEVNSNEHDGLTDTRYFNPMAVLTAHAGKPFTQTMGQDSGIKVTMAIRFTTSYSESDPVAEPNT